MVRKCPACGFLNITTLNECESCGTKFDKKISKQPVLERPTQELRRQVIEESKPRNRLWHSLFLYTLVAFSCYAINNLILIYAVTPSLLDFRINVPVIYFLLWTFLLWVIPYFLLFRENFLNTHYTFRTDKIHSKITEASEGYLKTFLIYLFFIILAILGFILEWDKQPLIYYLYMISLAIFGIGLFYVLSSLGNFLAFLISILLPFIAEERKKIFICEYCGSYLRKGETACPVGGTSTELVEAFESKNYSRLRHKSARQIFQKSDN